MGITGTSDAAPQERRANAAFALNGLLFLAGCSNAFAAELESQVTIGITHTDNIFLAPENEQSEIIYRLEPSFHFSQEASRITANADYLLQAFRYQDLSETEIFHQYDADIRAALIPDNFYLEVGGSRYQSIRDPGLRIPSSNLPISDNRQDLDEYYAEPSFEYAFGRAISAAGAYRHSWLQYSGPDVQDIEQEDADFSIDNYRNERGLTWALRYNWKRTEYELDIPWEYQWAIAELGFWAGANTRLFAAAGKESAWDQPLDPKLEDDIWEAGFSQRVGEKLSAEFAVGERSFGSSWRGDLELQFNRGTMAFSYAETPMTEGRLRYPRDAFDDPEVPPDDLLSRPGSTQRFIHKRLRWTLNLELRRSGLSFALFDGERTERTQADGTPLGDEAERGASLNASFRVGVRTELRVGGWWVDRELQDGNTSKLVRASIGAQYRLGDRTTLLLEYDYTEQDGESQFPIQFFVAEYVANTVSLLLTRRL